MYHYNEESGPQAVFIYERRRVREDGSSVTMALPWAKYKQSIQIQTQTFIQIQTQSFIQIQMFRQIQGQPKLVKHPNNN